MKTKEVETRTEFEIMEAFQKTEAYQTITKGKDIYHVFRQGYLAHKLIPSTVCSDKDKIMANLPEKKVEITEGQLANAIFDSGCSGDNDNWEQLVKEIFGGSND